MFRSSKIAFGALVVALAAASLHAAPVESKPIRKVMSLSGRDSLARAASFFVVNTPGDWREMADAGFRRGEVVAQRLRFDAAGAELVDDRGDSKVSRSMEPPLPLADHTAICVFTGKLPSGVPWLEVTSVVERADAVVVDFKITVPEDVKKAVEDPSCFTIVFIPKTERPVVFRTERRVVATVGGGHGGSVINGLQLTIEPKPTVWRPGDRIEFACKATNVSDQPLRVPAWGMDAEQILEFTTATGQVLPNPGFARKASRRPVPGDFSVIGPGASHGFVLRGFMHDREGRRWLQVDELLGGAYSWTLAEGDYTLRAVFDLGENEENNRAAGGECWTGVVLSNPVKVTYRAEKLVWGETVNGVAIALDTRPAPWTPGEIEFGCTVKNTTDGVIHMAAWGLDLGQTIEITDAKGNVLTGDGGRNGTRPMPANAIAYIPPKELWRFTLSGQLYDNKGLSVHELLGGVWHWPLADGDYTLRAMLCREAPNPPPAGVAGAGVLWTGKVFSAPVKVTVAPRPAPAGADLTPLEPWPGGPVKGLKLTLSADRTLLVMTARDLLRATADTPRWNVAPAKLMLTFTNTGDTPIKLDAYDLEFSRLTLDVFGPDQKSVRVNQPAMPAREMPPPGKDDYPTLNPGQSWTCARRVAFPGMFGPREYILLKPGEYNLKATYAVPELREDGQTAPFAEGVWRGSVTSDFLTLTAGAPGKPVNGLKMRLSADKADLRMTPLNLRRATREQPHYAIEPVRLSVTFTNVSDDPITVDAFGFVARRLKLHVEGPDGGVFVAPRVVDTTVERTLRGPTNDDFHAIEPGNSWTFEQTISFPGEVGANTYVLNATGNYKLHMSYTEPRFPEYGARLRPQNAWVDTVVSNELVLHGMEDDVKAAPAKVELAAAPAVADKTPEAPKAGEAVKGLKLTLSADGTELKMLPRSYFRAGPNSPRYTIKPVKLSFTFSNAGDKPIKLDLYDLVWGKVRLEVRGPDEGSVLVLPVTVDRKMAPPTEKDYKTIEPGKSYAYEWQPTFPGEFGYKAYILQKPGEYRIKAVYSIEDLRIGSNPVTVLTSGIWRGTVTSNEIVLKGVEEVAPPAAKAAIPGPDANAAEVAAVKPGEPVMGLKLTLSADATEFKMRVREYRRSGPDSPPYWIEPVKLTFAFTNVSDKPIKLDAYDIVWSRLTLNVEGPQAGSVRIVKRMIDRDMAAPAEKDYPAIEPGKTWSCTQTFPGDFGGQTYMLQAPGEYRVRVGYSMLPIKDLEAPLEWDRWRGCVTSNEIVLKGVEEAPTRGAPPALAPAAGEGNAMPSRQAQGIDAVAMPGKVVNGLQLALYSETHAAAMYPRSLLRATEKTPRQDAGPVTFVVTFMNRSDKPIKLDAHAAAGQLVTFEITGPNAKSVVKEPMRLEHARGEAAEKDFPTIEPGKSWTWKVTAKFPSDFGGSFFALQEPGNYLFKATYARTDAEVRDGCWSGSMTSNAAVVYFAEPPVTQAAETAPKGLELTVTADRTELKMTRVNNAKSLPDSPPYDVEPAKLTLVFTNRSDKPIKLDAYNITGANLTLDVTGPDAESLRIERRMVNVMMAAPTRRDYPVIEPAKSWMMDWQPTFPGAFGMTNYTLLKPGEYRLRMVYSRKAPPVDRDIQTFADGAWAGTAVSNEIVLKGVVAVEKPAAPAKVEPADAAGKAVNGLKLTVTADRTELTMTRRNYARSAPDSPPYNVEPATLTFTFTNVSDKPIRLDAYDLVWSRLKLEASGPDAGSVRVVNHKPFIEREMVAPAAKDYPVIEPGKSFTCAAAAKFPGDFGGAEYILLKPGEYRLRLVYTRAEPEVGKNALGFTAGAWAGTLTSNEIVLKGVFKAAAPTGAAPADASVKTPSAKPGEAVKGLKLTLKAEKTDLKMTPRSYRRSSPDSPRWWVEQTKLSFTFTNVSDKPIKIDAYDLDWSRLKIDVQGPDADSVRIDPQPINRDMAAPTEEDFPTFAPGESSTHKNHPLFPGIFAGNNYIFLKPGEYRVKVTYTVPGPVPTTAVQRKQPFEEGAWYGVVVSNEIVLTATLPPGERADELAPAPYKLGDAVRGLKLTLSAEKAEFKMTPRDLERATKDTPRWNVEPVNLIFAFTNVSDKPLKVNVYDLIERKMHLTVTGPNGDSVRMEVLDGDAAMAHIPAGPAFFPVIEPGKTYTCDVKAPFPGDFAFIRYTLMGPGEYKLRALYDNAAKMFPGDTPLERDVWLGRVVSNEIVLKGVGVGQLARVEEIPLVTPGAVVDGLKLSLAAGQTGLKMTDTKLGGIAGDADRYLAETARLTLTFTNVTDKPITLDVYDIPWRLLDLDAVGPEPNSVWRGPVRAMRQFVAPAAKDYPTIAPGKSWSCPVTLPGVYSQWEYSLRRPGEYKVKVLYTVAEEHGGRADAKPQFGVGAWTGVVASNVIALKCVPAPEKPANDTPAVKPAPTGFPMDDSVVQDAVLKAVKAFKEPAGTRYKTVGPQVDVLVSNNPATGGRVEIPSPLANTVFRQALLGYSTAAPRRIYIAVDRAGKVSCPFQIDDFGAVLAKEDRSKWTDREYLDAAKLYVHLTSLANVDGWCVLSKPQDFMDITFNMRRDIEGVKQRQAVADRIVPPGVRRAPDKVVVTFWAWHNIMGRVVQWSVDFGKTFAGSPNEVARFGGGGYD